MQVFGANQQRHRTARARALDADRPQLAADAHAIGLDRTGQEVHRADELGDETRARAVVDLAGAADLLDPAGAHHRHAVGERQASSWVMRAAR